MNILITGITGFIGSSLVSEFSKLPGYEIYGLSRDPRRALQYFGNAVAEVADTVDTVWLNANNIHCIIHLAGIAHDLSNQYTGADYFRINYEGTKKLYNEFLKSTAEKFIFVSSIKAAVDSAHGRIDENVHPAPATPYGLSKLKAENYISIQSIPAGKQYLILRPCMVYGPANKGNLNLLHQFVKKGVPYPFGAFQNQRSFLYVKNFTFAIHQFVEGHAPSGIYNLSDGESLSTRELVKLMGQGIGKKVRIWNLPKPLIKLAAKSGDALGLFFNSHTLKKLTENMEVSNEKVEKVIGKMPYKTGPAILETVRSF